MKTRSHWILVAALLLSLALVFAACGPDGATMTDSSVLPSGPSAGATALAPQAGHHQSGSGNSGSGHDDDDDDGDDDDDDDDDNDDEDDDGEDNEDDDGDDEDANADEARVRGLLFALGDCAGAAAPPCTLSVGSTLVQIGDTTRLDVEPLGLEDVDFALFVSSLTETGLPMKAVGSGGSPLIATRVRIDDELTATGVVSGPDAAGVFTMIVNGDPVAPVIHFLLAGGASAPGAGMVRIEARVPANLTPTIVYEAFEVEN